MKKRVSPVLLGAKGSRTSLRRTQLNSIFEHGKIKIAHTQAKQLSRLIDRLLARVKGKDALTGQRYLLSQVANSKLAVKIWQYQQQIQEKRQSGFTTLTRLSPRRGDGHEQSVLELLDFVKKTKKPETKIEKKIETKNKIKPTKKNA